MTWLEILDLFGKIIAWALLIMFLFWVFWSIIQMPKKKDDKLNRKNNALRSDLDEIQIEIKRESEEYQKALDRTTKQMMELVRVEKIKKQHDNFIKTIEEQAAEIEDLKAQLNNKDKKPETKKK